LLHIPDLPAHGFPRNKLKRIPATRAPAVLTCGIEHTARQAIKSTFLAFAPFMPPPLDMIIVIYRAK
jgi:hypothetical protein